MLPVRSALCHSQPGGLEFCSLMATIKAMLRVVQYVTLGGQNPFDRWFRRQSAQVRARIQARIDRIEFGNFGDHRRVGEGVSELRLDFGPGYRVYYGRDRDVLVILLGGGTKARQPADIRNAQALWKQYTQEKRNARERTQSQRLPPDS